MKTKNRRLSIWLLLAGVAIILAVVVLAILGRKGGGGGTVDEPEVPPYDRIKNPEYLKLLEQEKKQQQKSMGELNIARRNLEEAKKAKLEDAVVKELEEAVAAAENKVELDRQRMMANLRREIWKESHPEILGLIDEYRAFEADMMKKIAASEKAVEELKAAGAPAEAVAAAEAETGKLVKQMLARGEEVNEKIRQANANK